MTTTPVDATRVVIAAEKLRRKPSAGRDLVILEEHREAPEAASGSFSAYSVGPARPVATATEAG
ncbi:hypothetical protein [Dactylosporangium sp. NPDC051484]|uniref:hypothetical protein n=1 Tax=Dactylosporangium sp. NPDC051484 TaxID=3154942 RepID=UPI0034501750